MKHLQLTLITLVLCVYCQGVFNDDNFFSSETRASGLIYPNKFSIYEGESIIIRLKEVLKNHEKCTYRRAGTSTDIDVTEATGSVEWIQAEQCSIRVKNVNTNDSGFWKLTSQTSTDIMRGVSYVTVIPKDYFSIENTIGSTFSPLDKFSPTNTRYCYVKRKGIAETTDLQQFPQYGECVIPNVDLDPESKGIWNVKLGLNGKTDEISFDINVERPSQKFVSSTDTTNQNYDILKCNIENLETTNTINFCRFVRVSDGYAINLDSGVGNDKYSYHGYGFNKGHCGLLITNPTTIDKSLWQCYVGLFHLKSEQSSTLGSILNLSPLQNGLMALTTENVSTISTKSISLLCTSNIALEYCWFSHPNGTAFSVSDGITEPTEENNLYWYYGNGFEIGHCGITLKNTIKSDSGTWKCHVGIYNKPQTELTANIEVRVTDYNMVAKQMNIVTIEGENLLIECNTIPKNTPLDYCRFYTPNGIGFTINEEITAKNPINNKYFYNPNHSLKSGYCSIVVKKIDKQHTGRWYCAGKLHGWKTESIDSVIVIVQGKGLSVASTVGICFGVGTVVLSAVLFGVYRYKAKLRRFEGAIEL